MKALEIAKLIWAQFYLLVIAFFLCNASVAQQVNSERISFPEFEHIVKNEKEIPFGFLKKYVTDIKLDSSYKGTGLGVVTNKKYKLFMIVYDNGSRGYKSLISYDNSNKQVDIKSFVVLNAEDIKSTLSMYTFASTIDSFKVKYYKRPINGSIPTNNSILNVESWYIDSSGKFHQKH